MTDATLRTEVDKLSKLHLRDLLSDDARNASLCTQVKFAGGSDVLFDYSRQLVTPETVSALCERAVELQVPQKLNAMMDGEQINITEKRSVLHTACR